MYTDEKEKLPEASTCANILRLPDYNNYEILKQKLLYSIKDQTGFYRA